MDYTIRVTTKQKNTHCATYSTNINSEHHVSVNSELQLRRRSCKERLGSISGLELGVTGIVGLLQQKVVGFTAAEDCKKLAGGACNA
jgi:hypothetical protein